LPVNAQEVQDKMDKNNRDLMAQARLFLVGCGLDGCLCPRCAEAQQLLKDVGLQVGVPVEEQAEGKEPSGDIS
jgi:hypothetical protein